MSQSEWTLGPGGKLIRTQRNQLVPRCLSPDITAGVVDNRQGPSGRQEIEPARVCTRTGDESEDDNQEDDNQDDNQDYKEEDDNQEDNDDNLTTGSKNDDEDNASFQSCQSSLSNGAANDTLQNADVSGDSGGESGDAENDGEETSPAAPPQIVVDAEEVSNNDNAEETMITVTTEDQQEEPAAADNTSSAASDFVTRMEYEQLQTVVHVQTRQLDELKEMVKQLQRQVNGGHSSDKENVSRPKRKRNKFTLPIPKRTLRVPQNVVIETAPAPPPTDVSPSSTNSSQIIDALPVSPVSAAFQFLPSTSSTTPVTPVHPPKRGRGRPRKILVVNPPRKRGRPRKIIIDNPPKRQRCRPRKIKVVNTPFKRGRGRPRKVIIQPPTTPIPRSTIQHAQKLIGTAKNKYKCEQCRKVFATVQAKYVHKRSVHEGKRWSCRYCNKLFKYPGGCRNHEISIHKNDRAINRKIFGSRRSIPKIYRCRICHEEFFTIHARFIHTDTTHNSNLTTEKCCQVCGLKVKKESGLVRHMNRKHPGYLQALVPVQAP